MWGVFSMPHQHPLSESDETILKKEESIVGPSTSREVGGDRLTQDYLSDKQPVWGSYKVWGSNLWIQASDPEKSPPGVEQWVQLESQVRGCNAYLAAWSLLPWLRRESKLPKFASLGSGLCWYSRKRWGSRENNSWCAYVAIADATSHLATC